MFKSRLCQLLILFSLALASCSKNHLYIQVENINADALASTHVQTPDFRQENPPTGQKVIVNWSFPYGLFAKQLSLVMTARFWDNSEKKATVDLKRQIGYATFFFPNQDKDKKHKLLTYRIQVVSKKGELIEEWKQQLWTQLIDIDQEEDRKASAFKIKPSVSSMLKHGSVIETP